MCRLSGWKGLGLHGCLCAPCPFRPFRPAMHVFSPSLDGNDDGQPGGNYVATFSRNEVTAGGPVVTTEDGGLTIEENRSSRVRIEARLAATLFEIHFAR
jgi:hypothetical protein